MDLPALVFFVLISLFILIFLMLGGVLRVFRKLNIVVKNLLVINVELHRVTVLLKLLQNLLLVVESLVHIRK